MQEIAELSERLKQHFPWHKTKRDCLVGALPGMMLVFKLDFLSCIQIC